MPPIPSKVHTLIVSDIHLGFSMSRSRELLELLRVVQCKRLIILGDLFDDRNWSRLGTDAWSFLSHIHEISNGNHNTEIILIRGNHDHKLIEPMSRLLGVSVTDEYEWTYNDKRFIAVHGDRFDKTLVRSSFWGSFLFLPLFLISKLDMKKRKSVAAVDRFRGYWLRLSPIVAKRAAKYAYEKGADYIICGHTHIAMTKSFTMNSNNKDMGAEDCKIHYFNSGSWTTLPASYIVIDNGKVELKYYGGEKAAEVA
jgi:UDP-2,3-diacylglucosamine pyrophosphatase LpxH